MSSGLTPAQHANIRWQLILIPVYVWLIFGWVTLFMQLPTPVLTKLTGPENRFMRDFATFYTQGVIANERDRAALYDMNAQAEVLRRVVPGNPEARYPTIHGPQVALLFGPLARLSYGAAMWTWLLVTFIIYGACGYALWRVCPRLNDRPWSVFWLLLAAPGLRFDAAFAQTGALGLLCVTCAFFAFRANRPYLAGFAIGSLFYKPQLGLAAAFVFVCSGEWKVVAGAIVAVCSQLAAGAAFWGPSIFVDYVRNLRTLPDVASAMEPIKFQMHSWRTFFELLRLPPRVAFGAYVIAAAVTAIVALSAWRRGGSLRLRYSILVVATVLVNPHMWVYDFIILTPALMLLWDWALAEENRSLADVLWFVRGSSRLASVSISVALQWLLYFCYLSPLFGVAADVIRVQLSVLALTLLGGVAVLVLSADRQLNAPGYWIERTTTA